MQRNLQKIGPTAALSLIALTSLTYAQNTSEGAQIRNLENRVTALEMKKNTGGLLNPPGHPQVRDGADLFIYGDLIYWNAHETGLNYAIENKGSDLNLSDAEVKNMHGKWNWGFRVGIGYNMYHDGWDLRLTWLRFTDNSHKRTNAKSNEFIFPTVTHPDDPIAIDATCENARGNWGLTLNQLDLDLGREFFVSKWLTLRPHVGLRTDWIRQHIHAEYKNFTSTLIDLPASNEIDVKSKDRWWGIGLEGGLNTQWGLGNGWSIFGDLSVAIIYGVHHVSYKDQDSPALANDTAGSSSLPNGTFADVESNYRTSHPALDLEMGLCWDNMFADDRFHLGLQVGWEHHIYFSQNQLLYFADDSNLGTFYSNQGDLTLQGWTFRARFDF